jgi:hypothetical protein
MEEQRLPSNRIMVVLGVGKGQCSCSCLLAHVKAMRACRVLKNNLLLHVMSGAFLWACELKLK